MDDDFEDALYVLDLMQKSSSLYSTTLGSNAHVISSALPMPKAKRARLSLRKDPSNSPWMQYLRSADFSCGSRDSQKFRQRNRIPYPMFKDFVAFATAQFRPKRDAVGRSPVLMELKVLGFFRFLAVNIGWDYISELSWVGVETLRKFSVRFAVKIKLIYGPIWIKWPQTAEEISLATQPFSAVGLPGCVAQIDCTHVQWLKCPKRQRTSFTRSGHNGTTLSFLVVNGLDTTIFHISNGYPGTKSLSFSAYNKIRNL